MLFIDEHADVRGKEVDVDLQDKIVDWPLLDVSALRVVKNFVDPAQSALTLRRLVWNCANRRGGDWICEEARPAPPLARTVRSHTVPGLLVRSRAPVGKRPSCKQHECSDSGPSQCWQDSSHSLSRAPGDAEPHSLPHRRGACLALVACAGRLGATSRAVNSMNRLRVACECASLKS